MLSLENIFSLQTEYNGGNSGNSELPVENDTIVDFSAYVEEANSNVIIFLNNKLCTNLSKIDESCGVLHKCNIHTISNYYPSFRNTIEDVFEPNDKIGSDLLFSIQQVRSC